MLANMIQSFISAISQLLRRSVMWVTVLALFLAAALTGTLLLAFKTNLGVFEERIGSMTWRMFPDNRLEERITLVSIDEKSLSEVGPWPWPRSVMAELVSEIDSTGAQLQIHDIVYPAGERPGEELFERALATGNRSVLAQLPVIQSNDSLRSGTLTHSISGISCGNQTQGGYFPVAESFIGANSSLVNIPKGHITPIIDSDGAIRKIPAVVCVDGEPYPALSIAPFFHAINTERWEASISERGGLLSPYRTLQLDAYPGLNIPLDDSGNLRISFRESPSAFRSISAVDVLNGNYDATFFDNVWVLVGATAFGLDDIVPTPYSGATPGVELQARMLGSLLDTAVPYTPKGAPLALGLLSTLFALVLWAVAILRGRFAFIGLPLVALLAPILAVVTHGLMLTSLNLWIGWLFPAAFGLIAACLLLLVEQARLRMERSRVMQNLASYLPSDAAKQVAFSLPTSNIEAHRCDVTLLSTDLRNFSAIGESRPPEESASVLHYFFTKVTAIVEKHGGKIHEFKGDSVLALWDGQGIAPATQALSAAREIEADVNATLLPETGIDGLEPLAVGIGIEQGPVLVGSIGPAHRRAHTLCGETVTVTLRIQEMTAELASPILIGEVAARHLRDFELQSMGSYLLPGLTTQHILFSPSSQSQDSRLGLTLVSGGLG